MNSTFNLKPEEELLICCARTQMDSDIEKKIKYLVNNDLDWNYFITLALRHKLVSLVYWNLNDLCCDDVPTEFTEILREFFDRNAKKNLLMLGELLKVLDVLKSNDIMAIAYKGPILAILVYKNLALREFGDLDVFIPKKFFYQVEEIMLKLCYKPVLNLKNGQKKYFLKFQREYKFINDKHVLLEIKWRFPVPSFSFPEDPIILCHYKELSFQGHVFKTLSSENLLLVLCLHNAGHYWSSLRLVCDIVELINSEDIDWYFCLSLSKKLGIKRILSINLLLAKNLLNLKLPKNVLAFLEEDYDSLEKIYFQLCNNLFSDNKKLKLSEKIILRFYIRENLTNKIKDLINLIIIPTPGVLESVSLPVYLASGYHIFRILQLLKTYMLGSIKK